MNQTLRKALLALAAVAVLLMLSLAGWQAYHLGKESGRARLVEYQDSLETWRDRAGNLNAKTTALATNVATLEQSQDSLVRRIREEVGQQARLKDLLASTQVELEAKGQINAPLRDTVWQTETDTVFLQVFTYTDTWMNARGYVFADSVAMDYSVRLRPRIHHYWEKRGLFRRDELATQLVFENPNVRATRVQTIYLEKKRPRFIKTWWGGFLIGTVAGSAATIGGAAALNR